mmetsp:Transcript_26082/g.53797  ORF Transcript_26082/g.53797 Transcript_26082/m.53797 type:complete len:387 (+) Transcript_26082:91-1251(+)
MIKTTQTHTKKITPSLRSTVAIIPAFIIVTLFHTPSPWIAQGSVGRNIPAFHSGANWRSLIHPKSATHRASDSLPDASSPPTVKDGLSNMASSSKNSHSWSLFSSSQPNNNGDSTQSNANTNNNNMAEIFANMVGLGTPPPPPQPSDTLAENSKTSKSLTGTVVRTGARPFQAGNGGSLPSSPHYTTHKPSLPMISVTEKGVTGDYNHYRTVALKSTPDRALSILTKDVGGYIQSMKDGLFAQGNGYRDGDLGENVLVEGLDFRFFQVGKRYKFSPKGEGDGNGLDAASSGMDIGKGLMDAAKVAKGDGDVIVEITERIEPCGNLCKLQYINHSGISPRDRIARCKYFLTGLDQTDGLRGWYAKVIQGGVIGVGYSVSAMGALPAI